MKILLGSQSEKKINAVKAALEYLNIEDYTLVPYKVSSDVSDNPINEETFDGARNRNKNLMAIDNTGDLYISIEAGFTKEEDVYFLDTVVVADYKGKEYTGFCPRFKISPEIFSYVKDGNMLHLLVQKLTNKNSDDGIVGFLSNGKLLRHQVEMTGVTNVLIEALNLDVKKITVNVEEFLDDTRIKEINDAIDKNKHIDIMIG